LAAEDTFRNEGDTALVEPATQAVAITPNDEKDLVTATRGIYVGVSGDLTVDLVGGSSEIAFVNLAAGVIHPLRVTRVYATGTTATSIIGVL